jgi:hypothetical protein
VRVLTLVLCLASLSIPAAAQTPQEEVSATVNALFDAMRRGDGVAASRLFHPEARLQSVGVANGQPTLRSESASGFVQAIGTPRTEVWDERIWDLEIQIDGELATAWMQYAFHLDGALSHCGVNAFQLFRAPTGWQITQISDTRRREGCRSGP